MMTEHAPSEVCKHLRRQAMSTLGGNSLKSTDGRVSEMELFIGEEEAGEAKLSRTLCSRSCR
jgi:hypothetical protein